MFNPAQELSSIAFDKILGGALNAVVSAQNNSSLTTVDFIKSVGFQTDENGNTVKPIYVDFKYPKEVSPYKPETPDSYRLTIVKGGIGYSAEELNAKAKITGKPDIKLSFTVDSEGTIGAVEIVSGADLLAANDKVELGDVVGEDAQIEVKTIKGEAAQPAKYQDMTLQVPLLTIVPIPFIRVATTDIELNVKINSISNTSESSSTDASGDMKGSMSYGGIFCKSSVNISASVAHQKKSSSSEEIKKEYSLNIKIHAVQDEIPVGMSRMLDILEETIVPKVSAKAA